MTWGSLIQILINLPKILKAINEFVRMMEERAKAANQLAHQQAVEKLKNAQTEQEKKDAFDELLKHP